MRNARGTLAATVTSLVLNPQGKLRAFWRVLIFFWRAHE